MADDGSFDEFARAQYASLTRYAIALTGNRHAADDLVQETLAKVLGAWRRIRDDGNPAGYATSTMFRTYISMWRKFRKSSEIKLPSDLDSTTGPDPFAVIDNRLEIVAALRDLPRLQRAVLVATYLTDHTDDQISEMIGRSVVTVRSIRYRGLAALRVAMQEPTEEVPDGNARVATA